MTVRTHRPHPTHAPSLWPGVCPGGQFVRLVSNNLDRVMVEHTLPPTLTPEGIESAADVDYDRALRWLEEHPDDVVYAYTYNGDTGACEHVTFLALSNLREAKKGRPRPSMFRSSLNQCVPAPITCVIESRPVETKQLPAEQVDA